MFWGALFLGLRSGSAAAAMLSGPQGCGGEWMNRRGLAGLLPGDLTVTQRKAGDCLTQNGTNAMLEPQTALRYDDEYAVLERDAGILRAR
jgi:hypothetical protein